jgi:hydroxymethylpyrimidine/phosphomethylpyrimidine kinase
MKYYKYPSVLTIAGFDGSGGAGIQGDIKAISATGCYATSVLTAIAVQNTCGVKSIFPIPSSVVQEQINAIVEDIFPDAIKIGMVHTSELVETIVNTLQIHPTTPIVFDPVMVATSGHKLIEDSTIQTIIQKLFPIATLITPNLDEASILANMPIYTVEDMYTAGKKIMDLGCRAVLMKGGHLPTKELTSLYFSSKNEIVPFHFEKIETKNTHGSGCTLSSAIASYIAQGLDVQTAVKQGQEYVHGAIENGKDVITGKGNGPLNHFYHPQKLIINELVS